jgi:predicted transcriptional regulator
MLANKLKNEILKLCPQGIEFHLKNIVINGRKVGCSGFIAAANGKVVYINTEGKLNLYREAKNIKDYVGGYNYFTDDKQLPIAVVEMLMDDKDAIRQRIVNNMQSIY